MRRNLLLAATLLLSFAAYSASKTTIDNITYEIDTELGEATVTTSDYNITEAYILDSVTYSNVMYPVTTISNSAFESRDDMTVLTLPEGLKTIGDYAFQGCELITTLTLPSTLESLGLNCFAECAALKELHCTASTPLDIVTNEVFPYNINLATIFVPEGCVEAYQAADGWSTDYDEILVEGETSKLISTEEIDHFWYRLNPDTKEATVFDCYMGAWIPIELPSTITYDGETYTITTIGTAGMSGLAVLTDLTLPNTLTTIRAYGFEYCSNLSNLTLPSSVTYVGRYAFSRCTELDNVSLSSNIKYIGNYAFQHCSDLASLTLPSGLETLGSGVFSYCSVLSSITLPSKVSTVGANPFEYCSVLADIYVASDNPYFCSLDGVLYDKDVTKLYFYPRGKTSATSYTVPSTVREIGDFAFVFHSELTTIDLPKEVTRIGDCAILCSNLTNIEIPDSLTYLGELALGMCAFSSITIPYTLHEIGVSAFYYNKNLTVLHNNAYDPQDIADKDVFEYTDVASCILYVPAGRKSAYEAAAIWQDFASIIEEDVYTVGVASNTMEQATIGVQDGSIVVSNMVAGSSVQVYNLNGALIASTTSTTIAVDRGIYLVVTGNNKAQKVVVQ